MMQIIQTTSGYPYNQTQLKFELFDSISKVPNWFIIKRIKEKGPY